MSTFTANITRDYITQFGYGYENVAAFEESKAREGWEWNSSHYHNLSTYAANRCLRYLNKKLQAKYWILREGFDKGEIKYDEWVRDVGFVHQHPRHKYPIFSLFSPRDCYSPQNQKDASRETILLYRLKADDKEVYAQWGGTNEGQHYIDLGRAYSRLCYVDRMTKKEKAKLAMVRLLEPDVWLDGFGAVVTSSRLDSRGEIAFVIDMSE